MCWQEWGRGGRKPALCPCWGTAGGDQPHQDQAGPRGQHWQMRGATCPPFILAAPRPCSQLNLMPKGPHPAKGHRPQTTCCLQVCCASWGSVHHPEAFLPLVTGAGAAWGPAARVWAAPGQRHSPCEEQAQQGAEEDEDLVEHGRLRPQDGPVEVILWDRARHRHSPRALEPGALPTPGVCQMYTCTVRGEGAPVPPGGGE